MASAFEWGSKGRGFKSHLPDNNMKRIHAFFSGRVQGVGFRFASERLAADLGIKGWVKNLPDRRVEVVAEGKEEDLEKFLEGIRGNFSRYIQDADLRWLEAAAEFKEFEIRF